MAEILRLDKVLANMGFGSRRDVKKLIKDGKVMVNQKLCKDAGMHIDPAEDVIEVNGQTLQYRKYIYLMLHKPAGVISATEDDRHRTVLDLLAVQDRVFSLFPVGRLDKDTEGLLLLTNDGLTAHRLLSPKRQVPKLYYAEVDGILGESDVKQFEQGVVLDDGYKTLPAKLHILDHELGRGSGVSKAKITIVEGKYHQVKRMFASVGKKVLYLKREAMGGLQLDPALKPGQYRELTEEEIMLIKQQA